MVFETRGCSSSPIFRIGSFGSPVALQESTFWQKVENNTDDWGIDLHIILDHRLGGIREKFLWKNGRMAKHAEVSTISSLIQR
jgi:hypothetical protein